MDTLGSYLQHKHMEYCQQKGRIYSNHEWVQNELNPKLPPGDRISIGTMNHWINGGRDPDGRNISRLITVFGPEVMPYLNIKLDPELMKVVIRWDKMSEEGRQSIINIVDEGGILNTPTATTLQS
jgi:hypothetical protein